MLTRTLASATAVSLLTLATHTTALAQCSRWERGPFVYPDAYPNGQVLAMTTWDPDGAGPAEPLLVIGGTFTSIGGVTTNHIAAFNGFHWEQLGAGFDDTVHALGVFNGELIAGGDFTNSGLANHIARFNGATWTNLGLGTSGGGGNGVPAGRVTSITVFNNELIIGGSFSNTGGFATNCVAKWNGSIWGVLGSGMTKIGNTPRVQCLTVFNGQLYAGGFFDGAGGASANNIARWNGISWSRLGTATGDGADSLVRCFLIHNFSGTDNLVVGGSFSSVSIGTTTINSPAVARWTGSTWASMGGGIANATVAGMAPHNSGFIAAGFFPGTFNSVALWSNSQSAWQTLMVGGGGLTNGSIQSVCRFTHRFWQTWIMLGGGFQAIDTNGGGLAVNNLARVSNNNLDFDHIELGFYPFAFTNVGKRLIIGGFGAQLAPTPTFPPVYDNIIGWDGATISPLPTGVGGGLNGWVSAMAPRVENATTTSLAVGGFFTGTSGTPSTPVNNVALWTENTNTQTGNWSAMGSGFNQEVLAMTLFRNQFVAGGFFTLSGATTVNGIARFNGSAWTAINSGLSNGANPGRTYALATRLVGTLANPQHQLIIGGSFTTAGGVTANNIAVYFENVVNHPLNGWFALGNGFNSRVDALTIHAGDIYAGGGFTLSGDGVTPLNRIARWNGTTWVQVGGGLSSSVNALLSNGSSLYALVSGPIPQLMKWDGTTWTALNPGFQGLEGASGLYAMGAFHNEIHVGGTFNAIDSGATLSPGLARFLETGAPWVAKHPAAQFVSCGQTASLSITPAAGYTGLNFAWRKNTIPLSNGPTGYGSTISGANTATLVITNFRTGDVADYDCVLSNSCGSETSLGAPIEFNNNACCRPDINGDGSVGVSDLLAVINGWGACPGPPETCPADIAPNPGDGSVGVPDLLAVINAWGACP